MRIQRSDLRKGPPGNINDRMDARQAAEWTRYFLGGHPPTKEQVIHGCLIRIAEALEGIEQMIWERTPAGKAEEARIAEQTHWSDAVVKFRRIINKIGHPKGLGALTLARAIATATDGDFDPASQDDWNKLAEASPSDTGLTTRRRDALAAWIADSNPAAIAAKALKNGRP